MVEIRLGDTVKCKYTGLKGVAMAKTEFVNGCVQFSVAPKWSAKNPEFGAPEIGVDIQSLELVKKGERWRDPVRDAEMLDALEDDTESVGGPSRKMAKRRGY